MQQQISSLLLALPRALGRGRNPWNWCVRRLGWALLCLALGLKSYTLTVTGIIALAVSLFELHLPELQDRRIWRLMRLEREWRDAPWTTRKQAQAGIGAVLMAVLLWSLAVGDLALLLLAVGGAALFWVEAAQHAVSIADDMDEEDKDAQTPEATAHDEADAGEAGPNEDGPDEDAWLQ